MQRFGFQIGSVGLEFTSRDEREKAMTLFTRAVCMKVSTDAGPRFEPGAGTFSTYERDDKEQMMNCSSCKGVFSSGVCSNHTVQDKDWSGKFRDGDHPTEKCLCDGCHTKWKADWEVCKAQRVIASSGQDKTDIPF